MIRRYSTRNQSSMSYLINSAVLSSLLILSFYAEKIKCWYRVSTGGVSSKGVGPRKKGKLFLYFYKLNPLTYQNLIKKSLVFLIYCCCMLTKVYALKSERDTLRREQNKRSDATALLKEKDEIITQVMAEGIIHVVYEC